MLCANLHLKKKILQMCTCILPYARIWTYKREHWFKASSKVRVEGGVNWKHGGEDHQQQGADAGLQWEHGSKGKVYRYYIDGRRRVASNWSKEARRQMAGVKWQHESIRQMYDGRPQSPASKEFEIATLTNWSTKKIHNVMSRKL